MNQHEPLTFETPFSAYGATTNLREVLTRLEHAKIETHHIIRSKIASKKPLTLKEEILIDRCGRMICADIALNESTP